MVKTRTVEEVPRVERKLGMYKIIGIEDLTKDDKDYATRIGLPGDINGNTYRSIQKAFIIAGLPKIHESFNSEFGYPNVLIYQILDTSVNLKLGAFEVYLEIYNEDKQKRQKTIKYLDDLLK
ncbi:hypothetical protein J4221_00255 [Candidatus Pacearchaeota archaeon]|nr:hypothetical protein [Candidatus Pacearchaeota archaeon]